MKNLFILILCILLLAVPALGMKGQKKVEGYLNSSGFTERGVPFFREDGYYLFDGKRVLSIENMPSPARTFKQALPMVWDGDNFMMAGMRGDSIVVVQYEKMKGKRRYDFEIVSEDIIASSVSPKYKITNMKKVNEGILLVWYKEVFNDSKSYPCFSFYDGNWTTIELEWDNLSTAFPWVTADFAQMPDGTIWYFGHHDSNKNLCCIVLRWKEVISITPEWTTKYSGEFSCEGEAPHIACESSVDGVILAYHSRDFKMFSPDYFLKGARIVVGKVTPDGERHLLYVTDDYAERISPFALIGTSLITNLIDEVTLHYNKLYHITNQGKAFLIEVRYPQLFRYTDTKLFCNGLDGKIKILEIPDNRRE